MGICTVCVEVKFYKLRSKTGIYKVVQVRILDGQLLHQKHSILSDF